MEKYWGVLRDVERLVRASEIELLADGHALGTVKECVARGWLRPIRWHGPEAYHWELTDVGRAELRRA